MLTRGINRHLRTGPQQPCLRSPLSLERHRATKESPGRDQPAHPRPPAQLCAAQKRRKQQHASSTTAIQALSKTASQRAVALHGCGSVLAPAPARGASHLPFRGRCIPLGAQATHRARGAGACTRLVRESAPPTRPAPWMTTLRHVLVVHSSSSDVFLHESASHVWFRDSYASCPADMCLHCA